jgi:hypothetical protein
MGYSALSLATAHQGLVSGCHFIVDSVLSHVSIN